MVKYKVTASRRLSSRALSTHKNFEDAKKDAKKRADRYNKSYFIYKYHAGKPADRQYPYWSYVERILPSEKTRRRKK